ncbi:MAG: FAD-binding and (Fe-S)-binding domain-containing protein [Sciscionella sp.]
MLRRLRAAVRGDVDFSTSARSVYANDASNYRQVPLGVVFPRDADDVVAAVGICRDAGVALTPRGRGTSIAGNAIGSGVVLDNSRYFNRILEIDPQLRVARVQPGVVLDELQAAAAPHGLRFGPDPSTHNRCTLGGMIGNNACGSHSVAWGKTAQNVEELEILLADGTRMTVGSGRAEQLAARPGREGQVYAALHELAGRNLAALRTEFTGLRRQVSGYGLAHLLPENGFHVARALVGSEGTCVTVLSATVRLVELPAAKALLVAGFDDTIVAADAVPAVLARQPLTVEEMDHHLVAISRSKQGAGAAEVELPQGGAWLLIEMPGESAEDAAARATALVADLGGVPYRLVTNPAEQRSFWRLREEGAGTLTRLPDGEEAWPGWEDAAVAPENLGAYLREFSALMDAYGRQGVMYGHFGEGCLHIRINFDLITPGGLADFRAFSSDIARLIVKHGGSLSGEHGDGQARSALLPTMYSEQMLGAFGEFKAIWDPDGLMNPGKIVDPLPIDEGLRFHQPRPRPTMLAFAHDAGSMDQAARRCVGVGKCVVKHPTGVMCPSYAVTGEERHSTRGRAHLLSEMLRGEVITDGWRSEEVKDALDLCLSCKGCASDCPVDVDMASYKSEFLHHHYAGRVRPASHYSMGWLPLWSRLAMLAPGVVNAAGRAPGLRVLLKRTAGVAVERALPEFARASFTAMFRSRGKVGSGRKVVLWPDSFNNYLSPQVLADATDVLEDAGFQVVVPSGQVCCGLTWITTGQLTVARQVLGHAAKVLRPYLDAGMPVVALEPSCAAALRSDALELLPESDPVRLLAKRTVTLAEMLRDGAPNWVPGELDAPAITQTHCHQHAVLGFGADEQLLARAGVHNRTLDSGCCGLAGNFGFERGHYDISTRIGERVLLPEVRAADKDTLVVADGFSCRTQVVQQTSRTPLHLAQVLREAMRRRDAKR